MARMSIDQTLESLRVQREHLPIQPHFGASTPSPVAASPDRLDPTTSSVVARSQHILAEDGTRLLVRTWEPRRKAVVAQILVLHGYAEHSGRYTEFGEAMAERGIRVIAPDLRGHGRSGGERGYVSSFEDYHQDVTAAMRLADPNRSLSLLGHSNGGLLALHYTAKHQPAIDALVLSSPYLANAEKPPLWKDLMGRIASTVFPTFSAPSGIGTDGLSRDAQIVQKYESDPLVFDTANARWFTEAERAQSEVRGLTDAEFGMPVLFTYGTADTIASPTANAELARRIAEQDNVWPRQGARHEVLNEVDRDELRGDIADWLLATTRDTYASVDQPR